MTLSKLQLHNSRLGWVRPIVGSGRRMTHFHGYMGYLIDGCRCAKCCDRYALVILGRLVQATSRPIEKTVDDAAVPDLPRGGRWRRMA